MPQGRSSYPLPREESTMKVVRMAALLAAGILVGCMANGPSTTAQTPAPPSSPVGSPFSDRAVHGTLGMPLLLDRTDLRIGTTAEFDRVPTASELNDLRQLPSLAHVVLSLPAWPEHYESLDALGQLPPEADVIVVLPGYPPSRAAAEGWNYVSGRLRIVIVVPDAPPTLSVVQDLNAMRALERVIAEMDVPSRSGFERLQRPLSFLRRYE